MRDDDPRAGVGKNRGGKRDNQIMLGKILKAVAAALEGYSSRRLMKRQPIRQAGIALPHE